MSRKTIIIGATPNPSRYAFMAGEMLSDYGHTIVPLGIRKGEVAGKEILDIRTSPSIDEVDTVTLYVGPKRQPALYDYIVGLKPKRVIFNPGTENPSLYERLDEAGIPHLEACTLVMLRTGQYENA